MSKHRPSYINDLYYIGQWMDAADAFTAASRSIPPPSERLVAAFGAPRCQVCWDTGLCAECLGRYPQYCAAECGDGTCSCAAGRARRAVQMEHVARWAR